MVSHTCKQTPMLCVRQGTHSCLLCATQEPFAVGELGVHSVHTPHRLSRHTRTWVRDPACIMYLLGWGAGATRPAGLARRPTCTDASPEDGSVESNARCLAGCGFPADPAQSDYQWLPQAPAVRCGLSPPTAAVWAWTVLGAPGGSSCGQDRQLER